MSLCKFYQLFMKATKLNITTSINQMFNYFNLIVGGSAMSKIYFNERLRKHILVFGTQKTSEIQCNKT